MEGLDPVSDGGVVYVLIPPTRIEIIPRDCVLGIECAADIPGSHLRPPGTEVLAIDLHRDGVFRRVVFDLWMWTEEERWSLMCDLTFKETDHDITWSAQGSNDKVTVTWKRTLGRPERTAEQIDGETR